MLGNPALVAVNALLLKRTRRGGVPTSRTVDSRLYTYAAKPLLVAARICQGQTTNFRTPGGGFAPVLTL